MKRLLKVLIWPLVILDKLFTPELREKEKQIQKIKEANLLHYGHLINIR